MYAAFLSVGMNVILNFIFMRFMGAPGIALSTSIVYFSVCLFLFRMLVNNIGHFDLFSIIKPILHILAPTALMCAAFLATNHFCKPQLVLQVLASTTVGFLTYCIFCFFFKVPEFRRALNLIIMVSIQSVSRKKVSS